MNGKYAIPFNVIVGYITAYCVGIMANDLCKELPVKTAVLALLAIGVVANVVYYYCKQFSKAHTAVANPRPQHPSLLRLCHSSSPSPAPSPNA